MNERHKIIIKHLRKARSIGKHILKVVSIEGSAVITHSFKIETVVSDTETMITTIEFLPSIRLYKKEGSKIVDDENLLNEDIEKC